MALKENLLFNLYSKVLLWTFRSFLNPYAQKENIFTHYICFKISLSEIRYNLFMYLYKN